MTRELFLKQFGPEFRKLAAKPMFGALLELIDAESPAKKLVNESANDRLHGAQVFTNVIFGWESLRKFIAELPSTPDKQFDPPDRFSEAEEI